MPDHPIKSPPLSTRLGRLWLGLLPVVPPLALLGVLGLRQGPSLPRWVSVIAGLYAVSQLVPALFTPQPVTALVLALLRTALILGLLAAGRTLGSPQALRDLRWGLLAVYLTALINGALLQGWNLTQLRLDHPYYTPISLALAGALGVWIALDRQQGERRRSGLWWRLPLGGLGLLAAVLSGSRGPLAVLVLGAAFLSGLRRAGLLALIGAAALSVVTVGGLLQGTALQRLGSLDVTDRDLIWSDAFSILQAYPWSGVGSYLVGPRLAPPGQSCVWFEALEMRGIPCPQVAETLNNTWIIAHNGVLQQFAETGIFGTAGLFLLLGFIVAAAWRSRNPLALTVIGALLLANLTDNVILVPGPVAAEVFWLVGGWCLASAAPTVPTDEERGGLLSLWSSGAAWGSALLIATAFPLWGILWNSAPSALPVLTSLIAAPTWRSDEPYAAAAQLQLPAGDYRLQLRACQTTCLTLASRSFTQSSSQPQWEWLTGHWPAARQVGPPRPNLGGTYRVELRLWHAKSTPWQIRPLGERSWMVTVSPQDAGREVRP